MLFIVGVFLLLGIIGSILPIIPGPPISFLAILILHFFSPYKFNESDLGFLLFVVLIISFLDYWLQLYGVKRFGGGKLSSNGTIIGLLIGIFILPPLGVIIGPFIGAFIGAKLEKKENPIKVAIGSILGFLGGVFLKIFTSIYIAFLAISKVFP